MMTAHPAGVYVTPVRKLYCWRLWRQDWVGGLQPSAHSGNTLRKWFPQGLAVCMTASWYAVLMVGRGVISHRTPLHRSRGQPALHHCIWCIALGHVRLGCSAMKTQSMKLYMLCSWAYLKFTWSLEVCSARPWLHFTELLRATIPVGRGSLDARCLFSYTCGHSTDWNTWVQRVGWVREYFWQHSFGALCSLLTKWW